MIKADDWMVAMVFWKKIFLVLLVSYGLIVVFLYAFQERLIFMPQHISEERLQYIAEKYPETEEVQITTFDDTVLHGWLMEKGVSENSPLVIYFGGNAEEVSGFLEEAEGADFSEDWSVLAVNYRGYGLSEGNPGEKRILSDAVEIYDFIAQRAGIDKERIVVMGRSLGTGVAINLAAQRDVAGLILVSPYDSIKSVAQNKLPFVPVSMLIRHPFDSLSLAPEIKSPMLALVAAEDRIVSPEHSKKLLQEWGGEYELQIVENRCHNTIHLSNDFWKSINSFLQNYTE